MHKLLQEGKTDVLDKFVSNRTRRTFKERLAWSADEGKVIFEFEPREGGRQYPPRKTSAATKSEAARARPAGAAAKKATKAATKKAAAPRPKKPRVPAPSNPARSSPPSSATAPSAVAR